MDLRAKLSILATLLASACDANNGRYTVIPPQDSRREGTILLDTKTGDTWERVSWESPHQQTWILLDRETHRDRAARKARQARAEAEIDAFLDKNPLGIIDQTAEEFLKGVPSTHNRTE